MRRHLAARGRQEGFLQALLEDNKRFSKTSGRVWVHTLRVTGTERLSTALGEIDTFVVEQKVCGTHRSKWRGQSKHWYAPALGTTVRTEWSDNQGIRGSREVIAIISPG